MGAEQSHSAVAGQLLGEIERADLRPLVEVPLDVAAIGSDVTFYENGSEQARTVRLVLPWDADFEQGWVSAGRITRLTILGVNQRYGSQRDAR
jgi:transcription elongation GreA/GreB family factor